MCEPNSHMHKLRVQARHKMPRTPTTQHEYVFCVFRLGLGIRVFAWKYMKYTEYTCIMSLPGTEASPMHAAGPRRSLAHVR